jgi:hypothetical protein
LIPTIFSIRYTLPFFRVPNCCRLSLSICILSNPSLSLPLTVCGLFHMQTSYRVTRFWPTNNAN